MATLSDTRWKQAVQYRFTCEGPCGERRMCAVIRRRRKRPIRLCLTCYLDNFWRTR